MTSAGEKLRADGLVVPKVEQEAGKRSREPCHKRILKEIEELQSLVSAELHDGGAYEEVREVQQSAKHMVQQIDRAMQMARERERQREKAELYHRHGKMEAAFTNERFQLQAQIEQLKEEIALRTTNCDATSAQLRLDRAQFGTEREELSARVAQQEATIAEDRARFSQERQDLEQAFARATKEREALIAAQASDLARLKQEKEELADLLKADRDTIAALRKKLEEEQEKLVCKICFTRPRDGLIFPCMHFEYCFLCLQDHKTRNNNSCPTCRRTIDGLLKSNQYVR